MKYRKADLKDAEGIANVLKNSYNIKTIEEGKRVFLDEINKKITYFVAEDNGKIIGIATWLIHGLPKHQLAELDRIAVLPEQRGKGVAQELFRYLIQDIDKFYKAQNSKLRKLYLMTHSSNARAQAFYKKLGFMHEATLKDHYYKGEDEFVFSMFFE